MKRLFTTILLLIFVLKYSYGQNTVEIIFDTPGTGTWTCPEGVTEIQIELWGAGGQGYTGGVSGDYANSGGGGGAYVRKNIFSVVPDTTYSYRVGNGSSPTETDRNTWFSSSSIIRAGGGNNGTSTDGGLGGGAYGDYDVYFGGGEGGTGTKSVPFYSGGGGGGGNANGHGQTPSPIYSEGLAGGGIQIGKGGLGYGPENELGNGRPGSNPGGGGSGGRVFNGHSVGGNGGNGRIRITYVTNEPKNKGNFFIFF